MEPYGPSHREGIPGLPGNNGVHRTLMNETELKSIIEQAISNLFEHQPNIVEFTAQTRQTEWNLAFHLAVELSALLPDLDCDIDVLKRGYGYGNKRPDIIFHKRGTHESNYLVVELKRDGNAHRIEADIEKIHEHWFRDPLHYQFAAVINVRTNGKHEVRVFESEAAH
jgi:hypothetical protein